MTMDNLKLRQNLEQIQVLVGECLCALEQKPSSKTKRIKTSQQSKGSRMSQLDFSIPIRAFIKKYAKGMSGPKKFTLLLTYLVKGDSTKIVKLIEIKKYWNRMTKSSLLGMKFNLFYPSQARENDWVETKKQAEYSLRPSWRNIVCPK